MIELLDQIGETDVRALGDKLANPDAIALIIELAEPILRRLRELEADSPRL